MQLTIGDGERTIACGLEAAKNARVQPGPWPALGEDVILYAVCRYLRRSDVLRRRYVWLSYQLRLASGRGRRPRRCRFAAPGTRMELPGGWVLVDLTVSPGAVTVDQVRFRTSRPSPGR